MSRDFFRDLRHASRALRRTPVFTAVAIASLAIGIGATTSVFSLINAVHLSALPYPRADDLVLVSAVDAQPACQRGCTRRITVSEFQHWSGRVDAADGMTAIQALRPTWQSARGAERVDGAAVTAHFFTELGIRAASGRTLVAADERPDAADVIVLGHDAWRTIFGGDPSVLGTTVHLDDRVYLVVGILEASPPVARPIVSSAVKSPVFFQPLKPSTAEVSVLARLAPGATADRLAEGLGALLDPSVRSTPASPHVWKARVTPLRQEAARYYASQTSYGTLLGAVALVLLITCVNLAGLFLTRLMSRRRELVIQTALGAGRGHLARQMLAEVGIVTAVGGLAGLIVAWWGSMLARQLPAAQIPFWNAFALDARVMAFALGVTLVTGLLFGVGPVLIASGGHLRRSVRGVGGGVIEGGSRLTLRGVIVGAEIACTIVLLAGAGLLVKTFLEADARHLGMSRYDVLEASLDLPRPRYSTAALRTQFADTVIERAGSLAQVRSVSLMGRGPGPGITVEGESAVSPNSALPFGAWNVTPAYFDTVGIAMITGRAFTRSDTATSEPVAILDDPTAKHLFSDGRVLGRRLKLGPPASPEPWLTVVGVTATAHGDPLRADREYFPVLYRAIAQYPPDLGLTLSIRASGDPQAVIAPLRRMLQEVDPSMPLQGIQTVDAAFRDWMFPLRFNTMVLTGFAIFAVLLAAIGVYGVMAALVSQRTREIGIRVALGASRDHVLSLVLRPALVLAGVGIVAGLLGSVAAMRVLQSLVYGASVMQPLVFAGAAAFFLVVALAAAYLPARRALAVDQLAAFKAE